MGGNMMLAAILLTGSLPQIGTPALHAQSSKEVEKRYFVYADCLQKGTLSRRSSAGSPEEHLEQAIAACQSQRQLLVAALSKVQDGGAATDPQAVISSLEARAIIGPPTPVSLSKLPVQAMVGEWQVGGGAPWATMVVKFKGDSLEGLITSKDAALSGIVGGLRKWVIRGDGTRDATLHALFVDRREATYDTIPSVASEMNFINKSENSINRFDLLVEDDHLILRWVGADGGGGQARFLRPWSLSKVSASTKAGRPNDR